MPDPDIARNGNSPRIPDLDSGRRLIKAVFDVDVDVDVDADPDANWPSVSGYKLLREIGSGGGGDVFLALRDGTHDLCALKIIQRRITNDSHAKRAWRELDILQQLKLPFVPRVLDYGTHEGRLYFASDYIEGTALDTYCDNRNLSTRERIQLLEKLARLVQQLHEQGISHRDLKPSNVLVDSQGECHIIDFGIASLIANRSGDTVTETGAIIGSPAYMSPEQARGDRRLISTRSEVYALGAMSYKILVGETPHPSSSQAHVILRRVATEPCRTPRSIDPNLPRPLDAVLSASTHLDPSSRLATAFDFAEELRRWLNGVPVQSQSISVFKRLLLAMKRRPALASVTTLAVIALVASIFLGAIAVSNARSAKKIADLKERQDKIILNGISGFTASLEEERYAQAMKFLNILELFRESGLTDEEFLDQLGGARRNLGVTVLEATYDIEDINQTEAAESLNRLLSDLEEAGTHDVSRN